MPFHLPSCKLMGHFVLAPVIWFGFGGFQLGMPLPSLGFDCSTSCCCAWVELVCTLSFAFLLGFGDGGFSFALVWFAVFCLWLAFIWLRLILVLGSCQSWVRKLRLHSRLFLWLSSWRLGEWVFYAMAPVAAALNPDKPLFTRSASFVLAQFAFGFRRLWMLD